VEIPKFSNNEMLGKRNPRKKMEYAAPKLNARDVVLTSTFWLLSA